jgi:hypothetical protein
MSDTKIPAEVMDFIYSLTPDDVGCEVIGNWEVHFEGFSGICLDDVAQRMQLPADDPRHLDCEEDAYEEVLEEFRDKLKDRFKEEGVLQFSDPLVYAIGIAAPETTPEP